MIKSWATVGCMLCIGKTTSRSLHCFYFDRHSYSFLLQKIADSGYMYPLCWKGEKLSMILAHCIMYSWKISLCIFTSCGTKLHPVLLEVRVYYYELHPESYSQKQFIIMCLISLWFWIWLDRPRKLSSYPVHHIPYYYSTLFSSHKGFASLFL